MTQNNWNSSNPAEVSKGMTGNSTLTSHGVLQGNGISAVSVTSELTDGKTLIGNTGNFATAATLTQGTNCTITSAAGAITIAFSAPVTTTYEEVTDATKTMQVSYIYGANNAGGVVFTLPSTSAVGDMVQVVGISGLWEIHQGAGQTIYYGDHATTTGAGGILNSLLESDCITLKCITADTDWRAVKGWGNFGDSSIAALLLAAGRFTSGANNKMWGENSLGELGDYTNNNRSSPVSIVGSHNFNNLSLGSLSLSTGLKSNGEAWAWGYNNEGQLGNYTRTDSSSPVQVVGAHSFTSVKAGVSSAMGLKTNGEVWTWGDNQYGALGDETLGNKSSPILVHGNHSFIEISSGFSNSLGLKSNGSLWSWGFNTYGGLGDYTTTDKSSPIAVIGNHSFVKLSNNGKSINSYALKSDGSVWAWGANSFGSIGDYTATPSSSPVAVVGSHSFIDISSNAYLGVGLKANGEVWTWGRNNYGQLGDGTDSNSSSPVLVIGNHSFMAIMAGELHCLAAKSNGEIWSWGYNQYGQLGNGTMTPNQSSPVMVLWP